MKFLPIQKLKKAMLVGVSLISFQSFSQTLNNFQMFWEFTDVSGTESIWYEDICPCGTVYLINKSTYDNPSGSSIGSLLNDGDYVISRTIPNYQYITTIPAEDWDFDQVIAVDIPCHLDFSFSVNNFEVKHIGGGVSPYNSTARHHRKNLHVYPNPTVDAGVDQIACEMATVNLNATGTGTDYLWSPNGATTEDITIWTYNTTLYTVTNSNTYPNHSGSGTITCSASDDVLITVDHGPSIQGQNFLLCDGDNMPVIYTDLGQVSTEWSYTASGSNTSTNIGTYPHVYTEYYGYGEYELTATNGNGCSSTGTYYVELSQSAGSNIDPEFTMTSTLSGGVVTIDLLANQAGAQHNWLLYECSGIGTGCVYITQYNSSSQNHTFNNLSANTHYMIVHNVKKAPCNEWASATHTEHMSYVVPPRRTRGHSEGNDSPVVFNAFPNPSNGNTNIIIEDFNPELNYAFEVYNMVGQKVHTTTINNSNQNVDLSEFENGHYLFTLTSGSEVSQIKFIKQ